MTYRDRWKREVYRTALLPDAVRVALLALAEGMDEDGMVSIKRDDLSEMIGKSGRRVSDRLTAAIERRFLERVSRGQRNGAGRYRATLPGGPSWGHHAVPKKPVLLGTPCRPEEDSLGDGFQHQENPGLGDTMPSSRDAGGSVLLGTPCRPEETAPSIGTARARSKSTHLSHQNPATTVTDPTVPDETTTRVSQSARKREAFRWLGERYGLTEFESASVVAEVTARAPREIRALVPYLAAMKEGDLADIVAAVQCRTDDTPPTESGEPRLTVVREWCGNCDERTRLVDLDDGRVARCPTCHPKHTRETA